jgi:superfamily I DNA/RNA helicase
VIDDLNPQQKKAALHIEGPILVLAGAGTGKTKVIISRIAQMIASGIDPQKIVALSFTNKAAKEMQERLIGYVGKKSASSVTLSTFHSFCLSLLRKFPKQAGLGEHFGIASESVSFNLLKESLIENKLTEMMTLPEAAQKISMVKDSLQSLSDLSNSGRAFDRAFLAPLFNGYQRRLRLYDLVDFDDIVYLTTIMLNNQPFVLEQVQSSFSHFLIDEYQDTSSGQLEFISTIGSRSRNVCVVGDDDQSIYSWRGARPDAMFQFLKRFPETTQVALEQNYRCPSIVLEAANAVIERNTKRLGKKLWSNKSAERKIHLHVAETEHDQAEFVRDEIQKILSCGSKPQDVAILVRSNAQALAVEQVFQETSIPYYINGGKEFLDRKEVADLLCYLKMAACPSDLMSLFRVINIPSRKIGIVTLEKIRSRFEIEKKLGTAGALDAALAAVGSEHKGVQDFYRIWSETKQHLSIRGSTSALQAAEWLKKAATSMGLFDEQRIASTNMRQAQLRQDIIDKTIEWVGRCDKPVEDLQGVMHALHLDYGFSSVGSRPTGKVQIMSIHASKGLEFPHVFLIGLEEGQLPHERSLQEDPLAEEERRLFYVALTRAKTSLFLSRSLHKNRGRTAEQREPMPSRFLDEIPLELLEFSQADPEAKESKRMDAAQRLFDMFR